MTGCLVYYTIRYNLYIELQFYNLGKECNKIYVVFINKYVLTVRSKFITQYIFLVQKTFQIVYCLSKLEKTLILLNFFETSFSYNYNRVHSRYNSAAIQ